MREHYFDSGGTDAEVIAVLKAISQVSARMARNMTILAKQRETKEGEIHHEQNERYGYDYRRVTQAGSKRIMQNKHYLGDDFYPSIIDKDTFIAAGREVKRRSAKLGRNDRFKEIPEKKAPILFRFGDITEYFDNPVKQAEYLYSLIESEVI